MNSPTAKLFALCIFLTGYGVAPELRAAAPTEGSSDAPIVKLLQPGKDPKRALRLTAKVGLERALIMTMTMEMEMAMGENKMPPFKSPPIRLGMDMKVTDVAVNGDIRYTFKYGKPEIIEDAQTIPEVVAAMKNMFQGIEDMNGHVVVSSRGFTKEADITIPPNMNPQMKPFMDSIKQSLNQISTPFPDEPVGVGAKWETTMKLTQSGMTLKQSANHEITALSGDTGKIGIKIVQTADRQKMQPPGLPPGAEVELLALNSNGSGEMDFDLTRLLPSLALMNLSSNSRMMIDAAGQKNEMSMKLGMTVKMEGK